MSAGSLATDLPPEAELVLCCARVALSPAHRERITRLVQSDLDWSFVIQFAGRHRLIQLLCRHLDAVPPVAVPRAVRLQIWGMVARMAQHNQVFSDELVEILQLLGNHGILAVPYKGPALAVFIYGDAGLRPFHDLDILVRRRDLLTVRELLLARGYESIFPLRPAQEAALLRSRKCYEICLTHREREISLGLHWKAGPDGPGLPDTDDWGQGGLVPIKLGHATVVHLAAEEMLVLLCLHGADHQWESLGWLVDVAELIRQHPGLDWLRVKTVAARVAGERRLALGLYLAHHVLDAPLPESIRQRSAAQPAVESLACLVRQRLFQPTAPEVSLFEYWSFRLKVLDRWPQRVQNLLGSFNPSEAEWADWPLPRCLSFLYYPLRFSRLLRDYGMGLVPRRH